MYVVNSTETYSYKKVDHKKYIERQINLLCDVVAEICAHFDVLVGRINKVNDERRDA